MNNTVAEIFAAHVVESIPSGDAVDVIKEIEQGGGSPRERSMVAYDSGAHEGARRAYDILAKEARKADEIMVAAIEQMDVEISHALDPAAVAALQDARRPLFDYLSKKRAEQIEKLQVVVCGDSSIITRDILNSTVIDDDAAMKLGISIVQADPAAYGGFLAYGDDTSMECRCMACVADRWRAAGNGMKEMRLIAERDGKNPEAMAERMIKFGTFAHMQVRRKYSKLLSELVRAPAEPKVSDATLAGAQTQDLLASIMKKPK